MDFAKKGADDSERQGCEGEFKVHRQKTTSRFLIPLVQRDHYVLIIIPSHPHPSTDRYNMGGSSCACHLALKSIQRSGVGLCWRARAGPGNRYAAIIFTFAYHLSFFHLEVPLRRFFVSGRANTVPKGIISPPMSGRWGSYLLNTGYPGGRLSTGFFTEPSKILKRHASKFKRLWTVLHAIAHNFVSDAARRCVKWGERGYRL